jgi:uncharacterized protein (TIGR02246 family)
MSRCALLVTLAACEPRSADDASAEHTLAAADSALQRAVVGRDLEALMTFYADDAMLLPTAVPLIVGKAAIRDAWRHTFSIPGRQNEGALRTVRVSQDGTLGYTVGTYQATMQGEDGKPVLEPGKWLTVWRRQADGSWSIEADTYNTDIPPPDHK